MFETILVQQKEFFNSNATKSIKFRKQQLKKIEQTIRAGEKQLYEAIYKDFGKSMYETYETELGMIYHEIKTARRKLFCWSRPKRVSTGLASLPASSYVYPEPYGCSLVIGAWNYPIQLTLIPMISAIAAGNTVIVKPSELSINTSTVMSQLFNQAFPENYIRFVEGGVEETTELLKLRFDKVFFTGSVPVGKIVYLAAAKNLTPVTLELGGKSPAIVSECSNLKSAAQRLVWGKFINAGQTCVAPDYVLVHESAANELVEWLKFFIYKNFDFSKGLPENYVQIINQKNFDRLVALIDPKKVKIGGKTNREQRIIEPTVMTDVTWDDAIMKDEIFGPILPVLSYKTLDDAIAQVKNYEKPLALYVFSGKSKTRKRILREISFGGGAVNDTLMHLANGSLPFGGVGNSGMGNYHEEAGFIAFSHRKSVLRRFTSWEPFLKYSPYTKFKLAILRWLFE